MYKKDSEFTENQNIKSALSMAYIVHEYNLKELRKNGWHTGINYEIHLSRYNEAKRAYELYCQLDVSTITDALKEVLEDE